MAYGYRVVDREQPFLLPPDMRDWLPEGHLAWFVIDAVGVLDVSRFAARATPAGSAAGRAAFDPRVLLALLVYGYARGLRSSRKIERACTEDVAFRVICAQDAPDHATIARFRRQHFADGGAMTDLFAQVLAIAARAGLGRLGLVAVDGTKIAANAPEDANRTEARLRELAARILAEAEEADAAEDALFGAARGDELPAELADPRTRRERIAAALAQLEAERQAADAQRDARASAYLEQAAAGTPPPGKRPAAADAAAAQLRLDQLTAAQQARIDDWDRRNAEKIARTGTGLRNPPRRPASAHVRVRAAAAALEKAKARAAEAGRKAAEREAARKGPGPVANITDPDSHLMPVRGGGFIQGFNAQAAHSADGLCLGGMVTAHTTDAGCFQPMLEVIAAAQDILRGHARGPLHRKKARTGTVLADAGYLSDANLTCEGPDRLIATGTRRGLHQAAAGQADPARRADGRALSAASAAMAARIAGYPGVITYRQRGPIAETPFGNRKHNRNFRRFSMRGLARVTGEWTFENTIANLLKIHATRWQTA
ncbi:MAG: transposase [Streptosporangiaceae bacterium]